MAYQAITPVTLAMNTASADKADADGTAPANGGWTVAAAGLSGNRLLLKFVDDSATSTIAILLGDRPPGQRVDANLSISLAASDVKYVCVEHSKYMQSDGTIDITSSNAAAKMMAFIIPKAP